MIKRTDVKRSAVKRSAVKSNRPSPGRSASSKRFSKSLRKRGRRKPRDKVAQLHQSLSRQLPRVGLRLIADKKSARWSPRMLVIAAILFTLDNAASLIDRFAAAYDGVAAMFPSRRRPGSDPQGFLRALSRHSADLLAIVTRRLRRCVRVVAGRKHWKIGRWAAFGVDGSRVECRRSAANEKALGCAGREKTGPQLFVTALFHMGTGLVHDFRRGTGKASERSHFMEMLDTLPREAIAVADAGFTGYELMTRVIAGGRHLLVRVGSNVTLLRKLGWCCEQYPGIVHLWPDAIQRRTKRPPLTLRLITFTDGRNRRMHLLSDVLDPARLSDEEALELYRRRWGVEVLYRSLKQTLGRRKMVCGNPEHAAAELDWAMLSLWGLGLMAATEQAGRGLPPTRLSIARALRPVRRAIRSATPRYARGLSLAAELALAVRDDYRRTSPKSARTPVNKKRESPPAPGGADGPSASSPGDPVPDAHSSPSPLPRHARRTAPYIDLPIDPSSSSEASSGGKDPGRRLSADSSVAQSAAKGPTITRRPLLGTLRNNTTHDMTTPTAPGSSELN